ncbi:hypothetical protein JYU34_013292 [Plutella xylostella]|uniref:Connectin n=1 Tax=Plutella xylostella TaxID=51655 RepID=A0ABQ7Q9R2_PLUXY|nr:connectin [Plutella xylostella]KAG7301884.1 hypothetical protein JYU34_013292 [Plutella xylostella]
MERVIKLLLIIASLMTVELSLTESKVNDLKKKSKVLNYHQPLYGNICEVEDRRPKVHCYCDSRAPRSAAWADCWVFSPGLSEDDPLWSSFSSQPLIQHLIFNVRSDDALTFVPAKALVRLDTLRHLTIQFATLKTIPPFAFTNSSSLKQMNLKSNRITNLEMNSFSRLMMLSNLSLEDNQISELKRGVFFELPNLHLLHLTNNNLSLIHEGCFKHLNNLVELKLDSNYISVVTREMFEGLENLARLDLKNNKLTMIGNLAFSELWGLKELALDNNAIEYISERSFGGLTQLKKLTLSGNKLTAFYEDIIEDIRSLLILDLSDNLLETMSYETIRSVVESDQLPSTAIYLDGNPFTCDCRLSWVYALRNKTSGALRQALDRITCVSDPTLGNQINQQSETDTQTEHKIFDSYEYYEDKDDREVLYDEPKKVITESNAEKLMNIPLEVLPCPKELQSLEESNHPVQNEIRLKAFSKGSVWRLDCTVSVVMLALLLVYS